MPLTPVTWLEEFTVNLTTTNPQARPRITQLANGNIVVIWDSANDTGAGADPGRDVIGQIFDPLGNRVGREIPVNYPSFFADDEEDADIVALPSGGFIVVFEDNDATTQSIRLNEFDANGTFVSSGTSVIGDGTGSAEPDFLSPAVAASSSTSVLIVWQEDEVGGDSRIAGKIYDPTTNTYGSEISLINFPGYNTAPVVTALTNGNYVIACASDNGAGDLMISYRIFTRTGASVLGAQSISTTIGGTGNDRQPSIAALTGPGGGFVISWTNTDGTDTEIFCQRFTAAGVEVGSTISVSDSGADDDENESSVVALSDGGFIVLFDDDDAGSLGGRRFDANGVSVGNEFTVATGSIAIDEIDAVLLGDGRVAISFERANGEIGMEIIDTRDNVNNPGVYTPGPFQIGTIGDDTFTADSVSETVAGHDGNDVITESGKIRTYLMGAGDDRLIVGSQINSDVHDGGVGIDTIDWSSVFSESEFVFDLQSGTASADGGRTEAMTGFENLIGSPNSDVIIGTDGANMLEGGSGGDTLRGGGGDDTIFGGDGDDDISDDADSADAEGGTGNDTMTGSAGTDFLRGGADNDLIFGGANGFDILEGEDGNDTIAGGNGETFLLGGTGQDSLTGGLAVDVLEGNEGRDTLIGGGGNDRLAGGTDADRLDGGMGNDELDGGLGNDTYIVDSTADTVVNEVAFGAGGGIDTVFTSVNFTAPTNVELVRAQAGAGNLTLIGNDAPGTLVGNEGANRLEGRGGNDQINGNNGNDTLVGGEGRDTLVGGAGADTFVFTSISNSRAGSANRDVINGFDRGATQDRIDLSAIDANTLTPGVNNAFSFIGTAAFSTTGSAGQLRLVSLGGANAVIVEADINGDRVADFQIFVNLQTTMLAGDFIL